MAEPVTLESLARRIERVLREFADMRRELAGMRDDLGLHNARLNEWMQKLEDTE
jgi:hypothetical protein